MGKNAKFSSKLGFAAAAAGSAVGLYNMWRFPYEVGKYGGACFLFVYIGCVILVGYPLVVAELALGRKTQVNAVDAYKKIGGKMWSWVGLISIVLSILMFSFYNVIVGWLLGYCLECVQGKLIAIQDFSSHFNTFRASIPHNMIYTFLVVAAGALIVKNGVQEGLEKWAKILMPIFIVMLFGLILYALSLENSFEGVKFYLVPNFKLLTWEAVFSALGQSFISLSVGLAILITYGGYLREKDDIASSALIIAVSDTTVSFLAGMMLFPFIFHQSLTPDQGTGLVFMSLPKIFQSLGPVLGVGIGTTFFILLLVAAITSSISFFEALSKYVQDKLHLDRKWSVFVVAVVAYGLAIPTILSQGGSEFFTYFITFSGKTRSFFGLLDSVCSQLLPTVICFFFSIFVAYRWKTKNLLLEVQGTRKPRKWLALYLEITTRYVCPVVLGFISLMRLREFCS